MTMLGKLGIPKGGVCAELGVSYATFATAIWNQLRPRRIHLFNLWLHIPGGEKIEDIEHIAHRHTTTFKFSDLLRFGHAVIHEGLLPDTVLDMDAAFDFVYVMTRGGADHSSEVLATYLYKQGFRYNNVGYSSAIATVLFSIVLVMAIFQLRISREY